jgi:pyrimidine deaminase RibD-like protein
MRLVEFESVDINKLDDYLSKLCAMVKKGKETRPEYYGMVAAGILTPKGRWVAKINYPKGSKRVHAERAAIEEYQKYHGEIPKGSILITTLSPCNEKDDVTAADRVGVSCTDLINQQGFESVYSGYKDPTQDNEHGEYNEVFTKNKQLKNMCGSFADSFLEENFADGKNPQDKGDSARYGIPKHASISSLRKIAKQGGRKGQLAHWQANMRSGKSK